MEPTELFSSLLSESRRLERVGEVAASIRLAKQAIQLAQSRQDTEGEAQAVVALVFAYLRFGMYAESRQLCARVLELAAPDSPARADALLHLGTAASETDDIQAAEDYYRQAIDLSRQIGYDRALIRGLHNLSAGVYMPRGQFTLSLAAEEEALNHAARCCAPELTWGPLTTTSWDYWQMGQREQAEKSLRALRAAAAPGSIGEGYWLAIRGNLALEAGQIREAEELFSQTRSNGEASGVAEVNFIARVGMSRLNRRRGNAPAAVSWAADAFTIVNRIGYRHLQGVALIERGRAAWALEDLEAAELDFRTALELMGPMRLNFDLARAALFLAALLRQQERPEARNAWREAATRITQGGFGIVVDQERSLALPLIVDYLNDEDRFLRSVTTTLLEGLQRMPPAPLRIATLGRFETWAGILQVNKSALRQRKAGELLAMLLLAHGHTLTSDQIIESLWPERDPEAALSFLHQATSGLRRALEPELPEKFPSRYIKVVEGLVSLTVPEGTQIDFEAFESACQEQDWEKALSLYSGEFLPNYLYANWAILPRQRLAFLYQQALLNQAEIWFTKGEYSASLDACRKVLALEPWQEQAAFLAMKACLGIGNRACARRIYRQLEKALGDELDIRPQEELRKFYQSL